MYDQDAWDSYIVKQINKRDAAQINESVRHSHQHTQPSIADLVEVIGSLVERLPVEEQEWRLAKLGLLQQAGA